MITRFDKKAIIANVQTLMSERGIFKIKLGEMLGIKKTATSQAKAERANRFLNGKQKSVSVDEINMLSDFFGVSIDELNNPPRKLAQEKKAYNAASKDLVSTLTRMELAADEQKAIRDLITVFQKKRRK